MPIEPSPENPGGVQAQMLHTHLRTLEKLLLAIALALPDQPVQTVLRGPSRRDILEEAYGEVYPDSRR